MNNLISSKFKYPSTKNLAFRSAKTVNAKVYNNVLAHAGNTPLIKLNRIPKEHGLTCEIYAKCEFSNPTGSSKDRIAVSMMNDAEKLGLVNDKTVFLEPTSGNTGIGIAYHAALKDCKSLIISQHKNSDEKMNTMRLMGAEVIQISDDVDGIELSHQLKDENPNLFVLLNQFDNDMNPRTHYDTTGEEILDDVTEVHMLSATAGTGGTLTGVAYKLKEKNPDCIIVASDSVGSTFFEPSKKYHPYLVEGIGGHKAPITCDTSVVDDLQYVTDKDAFLMARQLALKEGLLCGGSSGVAMMGAIQAIKKHKLGAGKHVVVILPDGIRNYMSKFVCNQWMEGHLYLDPPQHTMKWWNHKVINLKLPNKYHVIHAKVKCNDALSLMGDENLAVVVNDKDWFLGVFSKDSLRHHATNPVKLPGKDSVDLNFNDEVCKHLAKTCWTLALHGEKGIPTIGLLSRILDIANFVVLGEKKKDGDEEYFIATGLATAADVLQYIYLHK